MPGTILVLQETCTDSITHDGLIALKINLKILNYKVVAAADMDSAIRLLQQQPIDSIFSTLNIAGGSIFDFIRIAQAQDLLTMPVTVITMRQTQRQDMLLETACCVSGAQYLNLAHYQSDSELQEKLKKHISAMECEELR